MKMQRKNSTSAIFLKLLKEKDASGMAAFGTIEVPPEKQVSEPIPRLK
jgi:hypothetical protein